MIYTNAAETASGVNPDQSQNRDNDIVNTQDQEQVLNVSGNDIEEDDMDDDTDEELDEDVIEQDEDTIGEDEVRPDEGTDDSDETKEKIPRMNM